MNRLRLKSESGFTLIELLVVVAIIGILAAIAIPQFSAYRKRGYEAQVKSDLRNGAVAQEAYFRAKWQDLCSSQLRLQPLCFLVLTSRLVSRYGSWRYSSHRFHLTLYFMRTAAARYMYFS